MLVAHDFPEFAWSVGEEGSDPLVEHQGRTVRVDEFASSHHLERMATDLDDVAGLGVQVWRYGMPWRLTEPSPGRYDWTLWDRALEACARAGLVPIVDLCHFGLPDHYPGFTDASWVDGFVRYVDAFLARYAEPRWFTPVNEPRVTAAASALWGAWNDRLATVADYGLALANVVLANLEAQARIRDDRDGWWIGSEGFSAHVAVAEGDEEAVARKRARQNLVWDLSFGVAPDESVTATLAAVGDDVLSRIANLASTENVIAGHDYYPVSVKVVGRRLAPLSIDELLLAYRAEAELWHDRYGVPFWVAETSNLGLPVDQGPTWLEGFAQLLGQMRSDGRPARGLCWYSRGDQYDWGTMLTEPEGVLTEVGLFDAQRRAREVAATFRDLVALGAPRTEH